LGPRPFSAEIAAAAAAFDREPDSVSARLLFIRSIRKLLARFSPVLWEEDPMGNLKGYILALEEYLDELAFSVPASASGGGNAEALKKIKAGILTNALKLEGEGLSETVPVEHIRRAAYWSRLAPAGKHKLLIIENADRMQDGARNSILKILEEPPGTVTLLLTCARPESLIPTIVSRLRPYRFFPRDAASEEEVIRRVFRETWTGVKSPPGAGDRGQITAYLDSFLPVTQEKLHSLAAFFTASLAAAAIGGLRKRGLSRDFAELLALGKCGAPIAEQANLGRPVTDTKTLVSRILEEAGNFESPGLFSRFLGRLLSLLSESFRGGEGELLEELAYRDLWKGRIRDAEEASGIFNQKAALALERLFADLKRGIIELYSEAPENGEKQKGNTYAAIY
jgi:DNA polymerase-3 subunit gamma/tau